MRGKTWLSGSPPDHSWDKLGLAWFRTPRRTWPPRYSHVGTVGTAYSPSLVYPGMLMPIFAEIILLREERCQMVSAQLSAVSLQQLRG